jgi:hypothetical protein
MAKSRKGKLGGPYLAAAVFCELTTEDRDGAVSAIRIIDQINLMVHPSAPADVKLPVHIQGLLTFKTGYATGGERPIRLVMHSPSGKTQALDYTVSFSPNPHGGANLRLQQVIMVDKGGLFWFDVMLDGKRMTRMPLFINVARGELPSPPGAASEVPKRSSNGSKKSGQK